ncbi:hypothetical protein [uncultured Gammaproteobacteria bacterium]|nr:hypothetical protein [uncultured Gammaproteobacteria bacterium]CAC9970135.1 hypothetical protein [uncultured Gammaproteobacteria bacterium]CAC9971756.1 hypothetical protein [uncultured Gammaproteobacteria bacterium]
MEPLKTYFLNNSVVLMGWAIGIGLLGYWLSFSLHKRS